MRFFLPGKPKSTETGLIFLPGKPNTTDGFLGRKKRIIIEPQNGGISDLRRFL